MRTAQLIRVLAPRELRIRYRQSLLNIAWAIITPLLMLAVYGVVLTQSFGVTESCAPYLLVAWTGIVVWTFVSTAIGTAVFSLVHSADLMTKLYFPREALPLAAVGAALAELGIGLASLVVFAWFKGIGPSAEMLLAIFPLLLVIIWTAAASVFSAVLATFTRDAIHAVNVLLRVGFFATTVVYSADQVPPSLQWSVELNPVSVAITALRDTLLCGQRFDVHLMVIHLLVAVGLLVCSVFYTRSVEQRIIDVV